MAGEFPYWNWPPIYYNDSVLEIPEQVKGMAGSMSVLMNAWNPTTLAPDLLQIDNATGGLKIAGSISAVSSAVATAVAPTYTEGSTNAFSSDLSGGLRITGTINASSTLKATTAAPTYVNNTDNPLSGDLAGNLRVLISGTVPVSGALTDAQLRATAVPVSGTFFQATQPVSGTFFQATQPVSLATNTPDVTDRVGRLLGHVTVDNASLAVTGTFFQATQPVSLATNTPDVTDRAARLLGVLSTGANVIGALTANQTVNNAQINGVTPLMGNGPTGTGSQRVTISSDNTAFAVNAAITGSLPTGANVIGGVTGTFWQATQPVSGTFFQATQPVSLATNTPDVTDRAARLLGVISTGANVIGALVANQTVNNAQINGVAPLMGNGPTGTGSQRVTIASDNTAFAVNATPPTLTKGTQGATGFSTQDLKDAGRVRVTIGFYAVAPAVADTLLSMVKITNGVAAGGATSIGVTANKTLRITSITFSLRAGAAAVAFGTMTLRQNPAGATVIGSQTELRMDLGNTAATIGAADKVEAVFPDGVEFSGTQTLGVSLAVQAVTNIISITITGFEY